MRKIIKSLPIFLSIFICHLTIFLAFYPGMCTYDLDTQIEQYVTHTFCTNHPLLHTLFVGFFYSRFEGNINLGYAFATVTQLFILDSAMTYSVLYLRTLCHRRLPWILTTAFYALFPVNSMLAVSHTKDTLFAAFGLIFVIDSLNILSQSQNRKDDQNDTFDHPRKTNIIKFARMIICAVLMTLLRNNAIYALVAVLIILIILLLQMHIHSSELNDVIHRYTLVVLSVILLSFVGGRTLSYALGATPGSIKEMMSIPAQIMGRVYNSDVSTEAEKELISEYIPNVEEYKFYISDPLKKDLPFEIWESKCKHFLLDSAIIALHHPAIAIEAVWYNIQGYINPFNMPYSSDHFFLARYDYRGNAQLDSKIPWLCDLYVKAFRTTGGFCHTPFVVPFNLGIYVLTDMICFIILAYKSRKHSINQLIHIAFLFPMTYLITLLFGPAAIIRYGFLYILISPLALTHTFLTITMRKD